MLCCGVLTLLVAAVLGLWRRIAAAPRALLLAGGAALLGSPALALAWPAHSLDRQDVYERAMRSLCGAPSTEQGGSR